MLQVIWVSVIMVVTKVVIDTLGQTVWADDDFEKANGWVFLCCSVFSWVLWLAPCFARWCARCGC